MSSRRPPPPPRPLTDSDSTHDSGDSGDSDYSDDSSNHNRTRRVKGKRARPEKSSVAGNNDRGWREELSAARDDTRIFQADDETDISNGLDQEQLNKTRNPGSAGFLHPKAPKLASALGSIADEYLSLDVLKNDNATSQYIAFLLDTIQDLQSRVDFLSKESRKTVVSIPYNKISNGLDSGAVSGAESGMEQKPDKIPRMQVLHRVFCGLNSHKHNAELYEDEPRFAMRGSDLFSEQEMLFGDHVVSDLAAYIQKRPEVQFIVFKEHRCAADLSAGRKSVPSMTISQRQERLSILSPVLTRALNEVAECDLDSVPHRPFGPSGVESTEMEAPYNFFFHHRHKLSTLRETRMEYNTPVKLLLDYLENFEKEYQEAEALFKRKVVTESHLGKLFRPNQIVVTKEGGSIVATMLDEWPERSLDGFDFTGWRWYYNGRTLEREEWDQSFKVSFLNEKDIEQLPIYPIEYLNPKTTERILGRGRRFWEMRRHSLVAYDGWDHHHDYHYVSTSILRNQTH